ncbi:hypothetical protein JKP88DRAFT_254620 [Tribonema minus]|uniref:Uncharacterized protein n=1 Tax=Tribonema minus TaxID=303371 RepID=A0A835Z2R1_9STRA|nr:hypothetical protein JKP88DRAFT_254620 [Tribonema minus]
MTPRLMTTKVEDEVEAAPSFEIEEAQQQRTGAPGLPSRAAALAVLATVPCVWGTYTPSVKFMESLGPLVQPPGLFFNAACYLVSGAVLATAQLVRSRSRSSNNTSPAASAVQTEALNNAGQIAELTEPDLESDSASTPVRSSVLAQAGAELGGWLFAGSTLQIYGLQYTGASRAAFLVQTTTIIVPLIESLLQRRLVPAKVLVACFTATVGIALMSFGDALPAVLEAAGGGAHGAARAALPALASLQGDLLVGASALFYSMHVIRLAHYAPRVEPIALAASKAAAELVFAALAIAATIASGNAHVFQRPVDSSGYPPIVAWHQRVDSRRFCHRQLSKCQQLTQRLCWRWCYYSVVAFTRRHCTSAQRVHGALSLEEILIFITARNATAVLAYARICQVSRKMSIDFSSKCPELLRHPLVTAVRQTTPSQRTASRSQQQAGHNFDGRNGDHLRVHLDNLIYEKKQLRTEKKQLRNEKKHLRNKEKLLLRIKAMSQPLLPGTGKRKRRGSQGSQDDVEVYDTSQASSTQAVEAAQRLAWSFGKVERPLGVTSTRQVEEFKWTQDQDHEDSIAAVLKELRQQLNLPDTLELIAVTNVEAFAVDAVVDGKRTRINGKTDYIIVLKDAAWCAKLAPRDFMPYVVLIIETKTVEFLRENWDLSQGSAGLQCVAANYKLQQRGIQRPPAGLPVLLTDMNRFVLFSCNGESNVVNQTVYANKAVAYDAIAEMACELGAYIFDRAKRPTAAFGSRQAANRGEAPTGEASCHNGRQASSAGGSAPASPPDSSARGGGADTEAGIGNAAAPLPSEPMSLCELYTSPELAEADMAFAACSVRAAFCPDSKETGEVVLVESVFSALARTLQQRAGMPVSEPEFRAVPKDLVPGLK